MWKGMFSLRKWLHVPSMLPLKRPPDWTRHFELSTIYFTSSTASEFSAHGKSRTMSQDELVINRRYVTVILCTVIEGVYIGKEHKVHIQHEQPLSRVVRDEHYTVTAFQLAFYLMPDHSVWFQIRWSEFWHIIAMLKWYWCASVLFSTNQLINAQMDHIKEHIHQSNANVNSLTQNCCKM